MGIKIGWPESLLFLEEASSVALISRRSLKKREHQTPKHMRYEKFVLVGDADIHCGKLLRDVRQVWPQSLVYKLSVRIQVLLH